MKGDPRAQEYGRQTTVDYALKSTAVINIPALLRLGVGIIERGICWIYRK